MVLVLRRPGAVAVALLVGARAAAAQIDYRNLDGHRPVRVTDAIPVERFGFELSLPYRFERRGGRSLHVAAPHLDYGIRPNLVVGAGADLASRSEGGRVTVGLEWNVSRETVSGPAVSLQSELAQPFEGRVGADAEADIGLVATRSFGRSRIHLNGAVRFGGVEDGVGWWGGVAVDRTLFRSSTLLVVEGFAERNEFGHRDWFAGLGARRQVTPTMVAFLGLEQRLGGRGGGTEATIGLSHAFAIAGLFPGGRR